MKKISYLLVLLITISCNNTKKEQKAQSTQVPVQKKEVQEPKALENKKENKPIVVSETEMILVPAGKYMVGSNEGLPNDAPAHEIELKAFYMDKSPVTVAQFRKFVKETGYKTEAHNYGDAGVYNFDLQQWQLLKGATWEYPFGLSGPKAEDMHPVTQVSWTDASEYAKWLDKRLPTEAEWEVAAKSGKNPGTKYSWGNELLVNEKYQANVWQGKDTQSRNMEDGFLFTSPVGAFGANEAGFTDMGGNVWNWCGDVFKPYKGNTNPVQVNDNVKVIRGGSFFYDQYGKDSFTTYGRFSNTMDTSLFNTGFRCAKDA